jgi:hypothetical protein
MNPARRPTLVCDVAALGPELATVDALARLTLAARRCDVELRLVRASSELRELVAFAGLCEVLRVEPRRQSEEREERLGVEEEAQLGDPPV